MSATADVGVIGGSGLYELLRGAQEVTVDTPYGPASDAVVVGEVEGRRVAFLPRHGRGHRVVAHRVNYRANLWALASLGVRQVVAPSAVGSLQPDLRPGTFVVPDQVVDRTWGREHTYVDDDLVGHAAFADPYCATGRATVLSVARLQDIAPQDTGTLVVVNGPRFSSRAESRWHAAQGWSVVGMTGMPEASLARELGLCYTAVTMVTDMDAGGSTGSPVDQDQVLRVMSQNIARVRRLVLDAVVRLPRSPGDCGCPAAVRSMTAGTTSGSARALTDRSAVPG